MKKIKVMKFLVSNAASSPLSDDDKTSWYRENLIKLNSPEAISRSLNIFFDNHQNASIVAVNTVDVNYHNNGRGNTVELWYTIQYDA